MAMGVEVALVQSADLRDDAQAVGTLKSRQNPCRGGGAIG